MDSKELTHSFLVFSQDPRIIYSDPNRVIEDNKKLYPLKLDPRDYIPPLNEVQRIEYQRELTILRRSLSKYQPLLAESDETDDINENIRDFNSENISLATRSMKMKYPSDERYKNHMIMNRLPPSLDGISIQDVYYYRMKYPYAWFYDDVPIDWQKKIIDKNMKMTKKNSYAYLPIPHEIVLFRPVIRDDIRVDDIISGQDLGDNRDLYLVPHVIEEDTIMVIKYPPGSMFTLPVGPKEAKYYNQGILLSQTIDTYIVREVFTDKTAIPPRRVVFAYIHEKVLSGKEEKFPREENLEETIDVDELNLTYRTRIMYLGDAHSVIEILSHYNKEGGNNSQELQYEDMELDVRSMVKFQGTVQPFISMLGSAYKARENPWSTYLDIVYDDRVIELDIDDLVVFLGEKTTLGDILTGEYRKAMVLKDRPNVDADVGKYKYNFPLIYIEDDTRVNLYGIKTTFHGLIEMAYYMS
jgi:hypothetical protein